MTPLDIRTSGSSLIRVVWNFKIQRLLRVCTAVARDLHERAAGGSKGTGRRVSAVIASILRPAAH